MNKNPLVSRLTLALALSLSAASLVAFAGEGVETTEIEVIANGQSEKVRIESLKVGETRQLYSEAGTLVTATRLADSLQLDIAGEKTKIPMHDVADLSEAELIELVGHDGAKADGKHVVRFHHAKGEKGDGAHRKVVVLEGDSAELHDLEGEGPHVIVKDGSAGKQVIVKRRLVKSDAAADQK